MDQSISDTIPSQRQNGSSKEDVSKLQQELEKAKQTIQELKSEQARQQSDLEEVNVILNLKDELLASKEVIHLQKDQIKQLVALQNNNKEENNKVNNKDEEEEEETFKMKFKRLQAKYSNLQNNYAWSVFQLKERISNDGLKYRRRLIHWKTINEQLEEELKEIKKGHQEQTQQLEIKWKNTASGVLQHTLRDLKESQYNVKRLENEILRLKMENQEEKGELSSSSSKFVVQAATQSKYVLTSTRSSSSNNSKVID